MSFFRVCGKQHYFSLFEMTWRATIIHLAGHPSPAVFGLKTPKNFKVECNKFKSVWHSGVFNTSDDRGG